MNIDIDRLHKEDKGRGEGQTIELLVKALQNSGFSENDVAIVAHNKDWAGKLHEIAIELAAAMGYKVDQNRRYEFRINNVRYFFISETEVRRFQEGRHSVIFFDNSVYDVEPLRRMRDSIKKFADGLKDLDVSVSSKEKV
jgi:hypothetical protein